MFKRILITLLFLAIYWIGKFIPAPGINDSVLHRLISLPNGSGENIMHRISIFSLDVMPYVSLHIIIMLLALVPSLRNILRRESTRNRKINNFIYLGTILLSLIQSFFLALWMKGVRMPDGSYLIDTTGTIFRLLSIAVSITAGVLVIIWMAQQINKYGIGNGISLFVLIDLLLKLRRPFLVMLNKILIYSHPNLLTAVLFFIFSVLAISLILNKENSIPIVTLEKESKASRMLMPFNFCGILPFCFTSSVLFFPKTLIALRGGQVNPVFGKIAYMLEYGTWISYLFWAILIIFFSYLCAAVVMDTKELSVKMEKIGLFIKKRDKKNTIEEYLGALITRIVLIWSIFLCVIAFLPVFLYRLLHVHIPFSGYELIVFIGIIVGLYKALRCGKNLQEVFCHTDIKEILVVSARLESEGITVGVNDSESYGRLLSLTVGPLAEKSILVKKSDYSKSIDIINKTFINRP